MPQIWWDWRGPIGSRCQAVSDMKRMVIAIRLFEDMLQAIEHIVISYVSEKEWEQVRCRRTED